MSTTSIPKPKTLKNGLKYLIIPTDSQTAAISILIRTGSVYENKKQSGIAHFLEHMMFKATKKRLSAKQISIDFEKIGAINNAFTSTTTTGYWAKASKEHANHILEILSDIYNNSQFPETEMEKEKGVVLQEMAMYEDMPQEKVDMMKEELMYGDQPFGRNILGTKESVTALTRKNLVDFYQKFYGPKNTLVVVAGGVDKAKIENEIQKLFSVSTKVSEKTKSPAAPRAMTGERRKIHSKKTDQVHLMLSVPAAGFEEKDRFPTEVLATILGRGMSSRLFIKMREELGICYYAHSGYAKMTDKVGQFCIAAGVDSKRTREALDGIWHECMDLAATPVHKDELNKAKQMIRSVLAMSMETCDEIASFYAGQYIRNGKAISLEQLCRKIDAVTIADIQRVAKKLFVKKNMYLTAIGDGIEKMSL